MSFCSVTFLFNFLPVSLALYYIAPPRLKNFVMLAASLLFYAWGAPVYVILLLLVIALDYFCGLDIESKKDVPMLAKRSFIIAVTLNVLLLLFFKYHSLCIGALNSMLPQDAAFKELPFPIGVSFYILQGISYLADVYRGKAGPQKNLINFALYISMFPQIAKGPIVRYADIEGQLKSRRTSARRFGAGAQKFIMGFAKKMILTEGMGAIFAQAAQMRAGGFSVLTAWTGCVSFAFRIYFGFSGYSDMAEGLAKMFGFEFRKNFDYPYAASSVTGFWRRWNISLVTWFRRYVYVPMSKSGFGRYGGIWNLLIVWILIGIWHGGTLNFLLWGLYHGIFLVLEKYAFKKVLKKMSPAARHIYTLTVVTLGWVFFFSPHIGAAFEYLGAMFGIGASAVIDAQGLSLISSNRLLFVLAVLGSSPAGINLFRKAYLIFRPRRAKKIAAAAIYTACFLISLTFLPAKGGQEGPVDHLPRFCMETIVPGTFAEDWESYFSERIFGEKALLRRAAALKRFGGSKEENGVIIGKKGQLFSDIAVPDEEELNEKISAIRGFAERHPDAAMTMILVPDAADILKDRLPRLEVIADQDALINNVRKNLGDPVRWADASKALKARKDEKIYYKTDHRWTGAGAFYVFQEAAPTLGIEEEVSGIFASYPVTADFNGDLARISGVRTGVKEKIDIYVPKDWDNDVIVNYADIQARGTSLYVSDKLKAEDKYDVFLGGDSSLIHIETMSGRKNRLLIIKDSFANCFIPFLTPFYSEIVAVDPVYFSGDVNDLMDMYNITDVIFLYGGNTFFTDNNMIGVLDIGQSDAKGLPDGKMAGEAE